ncbi:hypothetical protein QEZ40_002482 [Streptomyces katrae]|uniref:MarR family transcriptional regulator n=1 Tax=Streptomyces katrae TaxID=68223 RepID=A0ABT7GV90_9ACTN|nr:hypothetical protein [Streptomyces katrae]MDK9497543.1 hypothetical protein [Streptomyces katrae]
MESRRIVDAVHAEALADLADEDRSCLLRVLGRLAQGPLAVPAETSRPARRARQQ